MRFTNILIVGAAALSTAAIAQVASTPVEEKVPVNGEALANDITTSNVTDLPANNMAAENPQLPAAPGDPVATSNAPPK